MEERVFHPAPTVPRGFLERLRQFDPLLSVEWQGWSIPGVKQPHWIVLRRVPEREKGWVERSGIMVRDEVVAEKLEKVTDWVDEAGAMRPLDNRLMDWLAERDAGRYHADRFEGYKRMMGALGAATQKAKRDEKAAASAAAVDEVLRVATVPKLRKTQGHFMGANLRR